MIKEMNIPKIKADIEEEAFQHIYYYNKKIYHSKPIRYIPTSVLILSQYSISEIMEKIFLLVSYTILLYPICKNLKKENSKHV